MPVIEPVCAQPAAHNIRTNDIPNSTREDFMVMAPRRRGTIRAGSVALPFQLRASRLDASNTDFPWI